MVEKKKKEWVAIFQKNEPSGLSIEEITILNLYLVKNLSQKQIGEILQISLAQTRQKIARAVLALRKVSNDPDYAKAQEILSAKIT